MDNKGHINKEDILGWLVVMQYCQYLVMMGNQKLHTWVIILISDYIIAIVFFAVVIEGIIYTLRRIYFCEECGRKSMINAGELSADGNDILQY